MINTATYQGQSYTRTGRKFGFAVITTHATDKTLVEFATTRALAEKNASAIVNRVATVKRGENLRGWVWNVDWHRNVIETVIVPVSHS